MLKVNCEYRIAEDVNFLMDSEKINLSEFSEKIKISRTTLNSLLKSGKGENDVIEKIYSYAYSQNLRLNAVKEEIEKEKNDKILFHGSKNGLREISIYGARNNSDFGTGFYLGETFSQALSFVCEKENSSVYSFRYSLDNVKVKKFSCDLEWMLAICLYRGTINKYKSKDCCKQIIESVESADVVVAPIADNKMFYIMTQFANGDINADVALHSLSASKLGLQFVFKTEKALKNLIPVEKYYLSNPEREDSIKQLIQRSYEIDTKLQMAKRNFRNGMFIEEILK